MEKYKYDESNGLWYELQGDYYLPCLKLPEEKHQPIGIWGQRHHEYLRRNKRIILSSLQISGELTSYLADIDQQAEEKMKNFSKDYPVNFLENADADYFSEEISKIYKNPEMLNECIDRFFEMYEGPVMVGLDCYAKSVSKEIDYLTDDEIHTVVEKVAGVIDETLIETVMQGQQVSEIFGISKKIPQHEDFSEQLNQDKINFYNKWTHCKTKLGAPLFFSELSEEETTNIEGVKNFFANNPAEEQRYIFLRDEFAKTLSSTDKEIYYLSEKGLTQKEIADRLGYKTHSAVSKRMKIMNKDFKKFIGFEN